MTTPTLYTIASGKGGVGKTSLTINLAVLLARKGKRVVVFDGDTGLANLDVQLNLTATTDLADVISGKATLEQALLPTPHGFSIIAGRSGHAGLASITQPQMAKVLNGLNALPADIILLDAAAGITAPTLAMAAAATATLLVATPDPSSLTDAYALIKVLWQTHGVANCMLVANQSSTAEGKFIHAKLSTAAQKFLQLPPLPHIATIPADRNYANAVKLQSLAAVAAPHGAAMSALETLADKLAR